MIGTNCTRAIKPREIIPGKDDDPYAKRTALGWGIIGIVNRNNNEEDESGHLCHRILSLEVEPNLERKRCHFAFKTQVKEILNTLQLKRILEQDFCEERNDDKALSNDDRKFLKKAMKKIHRRDDGHYELPLPVRDENIQLPNNKELALNRLKKLKGRLRSNNKYRKDYEAFIKEIIEDVPYNEKHPMILPKKGHISDLVIHHFHTKSCHQGCDITHANIRSSGVWIISGNSAVGHHISKCVTCQRYRGTFVKQKMADLPQDRLEEAAPFTYSAVYYFGPFHIKEGRRELKKYGVLFTCLSSQAIHLETAVSLTTDSFLNAYRRFVGRRRPVRQLRSDQGSNFVGARNELALALTEVDNSVITENW